MSKSLDAKKQSINIQRLLPWLIALLALAARLLPGPRTIDDSFITYRYVYNILAGNGFVYNPGEHVLGTTTPLYTLLLVAIGSLIGGAQAPFPQISMVLNALIDSVTCLLLLRLGRQLGSERAGLGTALVWAIAPFSVTFSIGGLETSLYVFLLVGLISLHLERHHILAAFLASLALLTRPDALILLGPVGLDRLWQIIKTFPEGKNRSNIIFYRDLAQEALVFLLPTLTWGVFASLKFGGPIPHSITAKTLAYQLPSEAAFIRLLQHYFTPFLEHLTFTTSWIGLAIVLYPFLFLLGARQAIRLTYRIWPFIIYPWIYLVVFAIANPLIFRWYLTPPLPAYILFILIGADRLIVEVAQLIARRQGRQEPDPTRFNTMGPILRLTLIFFVILAPTLMSLQEWSIHPDHGLDRPAPDMAWYQLELLYRQAADSLIPEINQHQSGELPVLAAGDVGVLGFYTQTRILDTVGLNTPVSTHYYPLDPSYYVINYAIPPDLIMDQLPDYIVILEVYGRAGLLIDPRFQQAYTLREKIPTDIYGSDGMLIFVRKAQ
jgi:hypothetical protein